MLVVPATARPRSRLTAKQKRLTRNLARVGLCRYALATNAAEAQAIAKVHDAVASAVSSDFRADRDCPLSLVLRRVPFPRSS